METVQRTLVDGIICAVIQRFSITTVTSVSRCHIILMIFLS